MQHNPENSFSTGTRLAAFILFAGLFITSCSGSKDIGGPDEPDPDDEPEVYSVGGEVFSSPGTITIRLEWGDNYENIREIDITGDGEYSFDVELDENEKYRISGISAPVGWACRGKLPESVINPLAESETHIYCGKSESDNGIRVATWNLEWYDSNDSEEKKQAIGSLIDDWNFDVIILTEVLNAEAIADLISNHFDDPGAWDFRISEGGCSLKKATVWRTDRVTLESGYDLNAETSNGIIDEEGETWRNCIGRRPFVADFTVNNSDVRFTTASIHFKAGSSSSDCFVRQSQVNTFIEWVEWAGLDEENFIAIGDFNDEIPGSGICSTIDTLIGMEELYPGFVFATSQPGYNYSHMMGSGLVTYDTRNFQSTIDHIWLTDSLFGLLLPDADMYGNYANTVQANMLFSEWEEPDHNPPFVIIGIN
jgi:endonuclease/exonuclease/phosphatase family metal-dependent hydrolase